jgi:hypothetical protein
VKCGDHIFLYEQGGGSPPPWSVCLGQHDHVSRSGLLLFRSSTSQLTLLSKVWNQFDIISNPKEKTLQVLLSGNLSMTFRKVNNLFLCDVTKDITENIQSFSTSVFANKSRHSSSEVIKAEEARTLMKLKVAGSTTPQATRRMYREDRNLYPLKLANLPSFCG